VKDAILSAAIEVVALHGLNNWTVEEVANRAHCAKGLVNYHYRSKQDLLAQAARTIRDDRSARRLSAVQSHGTQSLDRLWDTLKVEVESGWYAAWLSFLASDEILRTSAATQPGDARAFAIAAGKALDQDSSFSLRAGQISATLDGLQLRMLQGASLSEVEEAYHQFWLGVLA
jgi:AcrR family transcriptional regulator